jgi:hypothetical protein
MIAIQGKLEKPQHPNTNEAALPSSGLFGRVAFGFGSRPHTLPMKYSEGYF